MTTRIESITVTLALTASVVAQSPQHLVVPAAYATTDALSYEWVAGASRPLRQQTLVGQSHLQSLMGKSIRAIELRRTAANEVYQGGSMTMTVTLSTSPNTPLTCDNRWDGNVGPDALEVWNGTVTVPTSPATSGTGLGTPVDWTSQNTIRIVFTQPFTYQGGTLCVDVLGTPIPGQEVNWWMADAVEEVIAGGSAVEVGAGCGAYGGPQHNWSSVASRSLVPGGRGQFRAYGTPNGLAFAAFGIPASAPIPLVALGIPSPGCFAHLDPALLLSIVPAVFESESHPLAAIDGIAEVLVEIPADPAWFGMQLTTQWFDLGQLASSNAIRWTTANAIPSLDMALNEGHPAESIGLVTTYLAHVMRFEYQ